MVELKKLVEDSWALQNFPYVSFQSRPLSSRRYGKKALAVTGQLVEGCLAPQSVTSWFKSLCPRRFDRNVMDDLKQLL